MRIKKSRPAGTGSGVDSENATREEETGAYPKSLFFGLFLLVVIEYNLQSFHFEYHEVLLM